MPSIVINVAFVDQMQVGRFISFEGIDGAGKSTQIGTLAERLRAAGIDVIVTREPGGTESAERLREIVLRAPLSARAELLLMFAARAEHVDHVIAPALAAGRWVLCDRFSDASFAYQCGGRGLPAAWAQTLETIVHPGLQPDRTFLFDLAPALAAARVRQARTQDHFETAGQDFFERVRAAYLARAAAAPARFVILDATMSPAALAARIDAALAPLQPTSGAAIDR